MCIIRGKMYLTEILSPHSELGVPAPSVGLPSPLGNIIVRGQITLF